MTAPETTVELILHHPGRPLQVDQTRAVRLSGAAARQAQDGLGLAAGRAGLGLLRKSRASAAGLYELVPPKHLEDGIRSGVLRAATPWRGDASVLVKDASSGRIVGRQELRQVKPKATSLIGPALWQAMAMATQQHYLAEIDAKLEELQQGVDEILDRLDDEQRGRLNHLAEKASDVHGALSSGAGISRERRADLRRDADSAKQLWHEIYETARRHVGEYDEGTTSSGEVAHRLALLLEATRTLAGFSEALLSLPFDTEQELEHAFCEEQDRLHPAMGELSELLDRACRVSGRWAFEHLLYQNKRPKKLPKVVISKIPVIGPKVERPDQKPLEAPARACFQSFGAPAAPSEVKMLVQVGQDGTVTVGPAADG